MVGLEVAAEKLGLGGQKVIADAIGISPRALRHKTAGRSGISNADLMFAARELERVAADLMAHAGKLRREAKAKAPSASLGVPMIRNSTNVAEHDR